MEVVFTIRPANSYKQIVETESQIGMDNRRHCLLRPSVRRLRPTAHRMLQGVRQPDTLRVRVPWLTPPSSACRSEVFPQLRPFIATLDAFVYRAVTFSPDSDLE